MTTAFRTEEDNQSGAISFKNTDNITLKQTGPELLGVPKAPTAVANTSSTQIATTEFVGVAVANAVATGGVQPSNATPMPDGIAVAGTSLLYSRGDHVHPDSTKFVKKTGDTMTGDLLGTGFTAGSSGNQSIVGAGGVALVATTPYLNFAHSSGGSPAVHMYSYQDNLTIGIGGFELLVDNQCTLHARGYRTKSGLAGYYTGHTFNIDYGSGANLWIDNTNLGQISIVSDARIKHEVRAATQMTERVMMMKPVTYQFNNVDMWRDDGIRRYGFIAQELRSVPGLYDTVVGEDNALTDDGTIQPLSLDTTQLIAVLDQGTAGNDCPCRGIGTCCESRLVSSCWPAVAPSLCRSASSRRSRPSAPRRRWRRMLLRLSHSSPATPVTPSRARTPCQ